MRSGGRETGGPGSPHVELLLLTWKASSMRMMPPGSARCRWYVVTGQPVLCRKEKDGFRGKGRGLTSLGPSGKKSPGSVTLMVSGWDQ